MCISIGPFQWSEHWTSAAPSPPPPPLLLQAYVIHKRCFYPSRVLYCAMTFYYLLLCYCIIFVHTYPYKHVHMLYVCFLFYFLNCLIFKKCFPFVIVFWEGGGIESGIPIESWSSVFILKKKGGEREAWCVFLYILLWLRVARLCTFSHLLAVVGAPFQKASYAGNIQLPASLWPPPLTGQGAPKGLRALTLTWHPVSQSINQSITCNRRVIFYTRSSIECVCVSFPKTNIWFQTCVPQNHACAFFSTSGACLPFLICVSPSAVRHLVLLQKMAV